MHLTWLFNTLSGYFDHCCSFDGSSWDIISGIPVSISDCLLHVCPFNITGSSSPALLPLIINNLGKANPDENFCLDMSLN